MDLLPPVPVVFFFKKKHTVSPPGTARTGCLRRIRITSQENDMPIYEYRCNVCATVFEVIVTPSSKEKEIACSQCGGTDITRMLSAVSSIRKGPALPAATPSACRAKSGFS
jgi:putative FmdB family regulatory protein